MAPTQIYKHTWLNAKHYNQLIFVDEEYHVKTLACGIKHDKNIIEPIRIFLLRMTV